MGSQQDGINIAASKDQVKKPDPDADVKMSLGKIKNKFIVMSGKGGVGKTSTSVNLSIALANKGFKIGLMDADLHGPDIPRMLGLSNMLGLDTATEDNSQYRFYLSIRQFLCCGYQH